MKKIITLALAVLMITAMAVVVCAADTENWVVGNGFNLVDAEKNVVANNSPVTATEKSATVIDVTHGGYYQDGANWGGVASKAAYALEDLTVKVSYNKVPAVDVTTDCWMYIGVLSKPEMFKVGDVAGNPGYMNLIRFGTQKIEFYEGETNFKSTGNITAFPQVFGVKAGDVVTMQFVKNEKGFYQVKYTNGAYSVTTEQTFDLDRILGGKGHVVVSASRIASEKDAFAYTVEVTAKQPAKEEAKEEVKEEAKEPVAGANWVAGNGFNLVDAEKNVVANNSPVTIAEKSETVVDVTHGGYYQNGENWGGVASAKAYALENLTVRVTYTKVPAVDATTDCWMYIGVLSKPEMFKVGDVAGNPGYMNLMRFGTGKFEIYDGETSFKSVGTVADCTDLFGIKAGEAVTVQFLKNASGLYQVKYTKGDLSYTTEKAFDFDKLLGGKGYVVVSASRIASEKDAFAYTVEINPAPVAPEVSVFLDGARINFADQAPVIVEGRTLVPLRAIFEALGATVEWDGATKTVTAVRGQDTIKLTIGDTKLYKNGEVAYELDVPAQIMGSGFTMVPVRAISESFGCKVDWVAALRAVVITAK
ncbi:MAG: copper amine oxidase N-terminal domain-containing protein [Clostridia bacterium]|nr:copper amine oxidase N-terminal domain-containing protein [Clostridia bacterium]